MGSGQSTPPPGTNREKADAAATATTPKPNRSLEKSFTEKVAPSFVHTVSHELSDEELALIRRLVKVTSSTLEDACGVFPNKLDAHNASLEAVDVAEEIMSRTSYAFNFVHHGQHKSGNIRALLEQHTDVPRSNTTKLKFDNGKKTELNQSLQARSGVTSIDLAVQLRARSKQNLLQPISSQRSLEVESEAEAEAEAEADVEAKAEAEAEVEGKAVAKKAANADASVAEDAVESASKAEPGVENKAVDAQNSQANVVEGAESSSEGAPTAAETAVASSDGAASTSTQSEVVRDSEKATKSKGLKRRKSSKRSTGESKKTASAASSEANPGAEMQQPEQQQQQQQQQQP